MRMTANDKILWAHRASVRRLARVAPLMLGCSALDAELFGAEQAPLPTKGSSSLACPRSNKIEFTYSCMSMMKGVLEVGKSFAFILKDHTLTHLAQASPLSTPPTDAQSLRLVLTGPTLARLSQLGGMTFWATAFSRAVGVTTSKCPVASSAAATATTSLTLWLQAWTGMSESAMMPQVEK